MEAKGDLLSLFRLKRDLNELFFRAFYNIFQFPEGLNSTHILTMIHLDHLETCPMTQISHILQMEKGSFTPVAKKLESLGYIKKERNSGDRRIFELSLTPRGRILVTRFKDEHQAFIREQLSVISAEEQGDYFDLMNRLNGINSRLREELGITD